MSLLLASDRLQPSPLQTIEQWNRRPDALLWPLWGTDNAFQGAWRRLLQIAMIAPGPFKKTRKSAGTAAEAQCPGAGHLLLGNTWAVFEQYYLDPAQVTPPQPPELG